MSESGEGGDGLKEFELPYLQVVTEGETPEVIGDGKLNFADPEQIKLEMDRSFLRYFLYKAGGASSCSTKPHQRGPSKEYMENYARMNWGVNPKAGDKPN